MRRAAQLCQWATHFFFLTGFAIFALGLTGIGDDSGQWLLRLEWSGAFFSAGASAQAMSWRLESWWANAELARIERELEEQQQKSRPEAASL